MTTEHNIGNNKGLYKQYWKQQRGYMSTLNVMKKISFFCHFPHPECIMIHISAVFCNENNGRKIRNLQVRSLQIHYLQLCNLQIHNGNKFVA